MIHLFEKLSNTQVRLKADNDSNSQVKVHVPQLLSLTDERIYTAHVSKTKTRVLILGNNQLQGELPASIGNLRKLQLLDVGSNEMTSTIPSSFENLESLKYLVLESNRFNGTVDVLESMKNLAVLVIRSNSFSGPLPDGLFSGTFDNIVVDVGDNKLTGDLPASFANMSNLVSLIGPKNSFVDSATTEAVCDNTNTTNFIMDCDACECCEICCDGENDAVCGFQLDVRTHKIYMIRGFLL